jgi:hypothetical protein
MFPGLHFTVDSPEPEGYYALQPQHVAPMNAK